MLPTGGMEVNASDNTLVSLVRSHPVTSKDIENIAKDLHVDGEKLLRILETHPLFNPRS